MTQFHLKPFAIRCGSTVALLLLLSGCVTMNPGVSNYQPPSGAKTVDLVIRGSTEPGASYTIFLFSDPGACRGLQSLGTGGADRHPEKALLPVNQISGLSVVFIKPGNRYCVVRPSFTPKEGQRYLLAVRSEPGRCQAGISNITDPDHIAKESSTVFKDAQCNSFASEFTESPSNADARSNLPTAPKDEPAKLLNKPFDEDLKGLIKKD